MTQRRIARFGPPAHFYECPRWHDGRWYASDMRGGTVYSFDAEGAARIELVIDDRPGGLGWAADGGLLVVSMVAKTLLRLGADGGPVVACELGGLFGETEGFLNDLAVSPAGHVYIGFDADPHRYGNTADLGMIVQVPPVGAPAVVARNLAFPNGMMVTPDGATLVVAETMQPRLSGFALGGDGRLGLRRDWGLVDRGNALRTAGDAAIGERAVTLDGCAMDSAGHVWAADVGSGCLRIAPGGEVVEAVHLPDGLRAFACALGGADGRTLMICGADDNFADRTSRREGYLFTTSVAVPA